MPMRYRAVDAHSHRYQVNRDSHHRLASAPTHPNVTDASTKRVFKIPRRDESRYSFGDGTAGSRLSLQEVFNRSYADVEGCSYNKDERLNKVDIFGINRDIRCHLYDIKKIGRGELTFKDLMKQHPVFLNELRGIIERKWDILQKCKAQWGVDWAIQRVLQRDGEVTREGTARFRAWKPIRNRQGSVRRSTANRQNARRQLVAHESRRSGEDATGRSESRPSQHYQQHEADGRVVDNHDTSRLDGHGADDRNEAPANSSSGDEDSTLENEGSYDSERPNKCNEDSEEDDSEEDDSGDERVTVARRGTRMTGVSAPPVRTAGTRRSSTNRHAVSPIEEDADASSLTDLEDRIERGKSKQPDCITPTLPVVKRSGSGPARNSRTKRRKLRPRRHRVFQWRRRRKRFRKSAPVRDRLGTAINERGEIRNGFYVALSKARYNFSHLRKGLTVQ